MNIWDKAFIEDRDIWTSQGVPTTTLSLFKKYVSSNTSILEVGCGTGTESIQLSDLGYKVTAIDISKSALEKAMQNRSDVRWLIGDFMEDRLHQEYGTCYDKGFFHNLEGDENREKFIKQVAYSLQDDGIWINVSGSPDLPKNTMDHGMLYLNDIVRNVEPYFEILEVIKAPYGKTKGDLVFQAWHSVFRRR